MNKKQTWENAQEILESLGLSKAKNEEALKLFGALLAPKVGGGGKGSRPLPKMIDGEAHYYCRYTAQYYPSSEMIYQNDDKRAKLEDKGYSKLGISLWNKGQKYLKNLKTKSVEIAFDDEATEEEMKEGIRMHKEAKHLAEHNLMNNAEYLVENFSN